MGDKDPVSYIDETLTVDASVSSATVLTLLSRNIPAVAPEGSVGDRLFSYRADSRFAPSS